MRISRLGLDNHPAMRISSGESLTIAIRELIIGATVTTEDELQLDDPEYNWSHGSGGW